MRNEAGRGREGALSLLQPGQMLAEGLSMLDGGADIAGGEKCINLIYNIKKIKKIKKTFDIVKGVCYYIEVDGRKEKTTAE